MYKLPWRKCCNCSLSSCKSALIWSFILFPSRLTFPFQGKQHCLPQQLLNGLRQILWGRLGKGAPSFQQKLIWSCSWCTEGLQPCSFGGKDVCAPTLVPVVSWAGVSSEGVSGQMFHVLRVLRALEVSLLGTARVCQGLLFLLFLALN